MHRTVTQASSVQLMNSPVPEPILKHLKFARDRIAAGDLQGAAASLNKANKVSPNDARIFMLAGLMAEKAGNIPGTFEALRRSVREAPDWGPGMLELALFLARQNQFQEAVELAEKVAALEPSNTLVLASVIDIAHRAGHTEMAVRHLQRGLTLVPGDLTLRRMLARDLATLGRHDESLAAWGALIEENPADVQARMGRVQTLIEMGRASDAAPDTAFLLAGAPDDAVYAYFDTIAQGRTPLEQPVELHRALFDGMAPVYDQHMVRGLKYQLPKRVADALLAEHPDKHFNLLDLGCGTGLLGVCLGRIDGFLIGVDISLPMIEQAARHQVYDKFHHVNVLNALRETPEAQYEVITALDVFIYIGDLTQAVPDALRILTPGGTFIFSCEAADEDGPDLVLQASNRYAHKLTHVKALCQQAGFISVEIESLTLRQEGDQPVEGYLVRASKAA